MSISPSVQAEEPRTHSLIERMLLRISLIILVLSSLFFICCLCNLVWYLAINAVSGIEAIMTATPTSMVHPRSWYSEMKASVIWNMPDQAI